MIREEIRKVSSGYLMLVLLAVLQLGFAYGVFRAAVAQSPVGIVAAILASVVVRIGRPNLSTPLCSSSGNTQVRLTTRG